MPQWLPVLLIVVGLFGGLVLFVRWYRTFNALAEQDRKRFRRAIGEGPWPILIAIALSLGLLCSQNVPQAMAFTLFIAATAIVHDRWRQQRIRSGLVEPLFVPLLTKDRWLSCGSSVLLIVGLTLMKLFRV